MHPIYPLDDQGNIKIRPIGFVPSGVRAQQTGGFREVESEVIIRPELEPLLDGIDEFSHLVVICWLSEITAFSEQRRPQGLDDVPIVGMLASR